MSEDRCGGKVGCCGGFQFKVSILVFGRMKAMDERRVYHIMEPFGWIGRAKSGGTGGIFALDLLLGGCQCCRCRVRTVE